MPKINVLSREVAELIAAGEVIERPSSVIKELVENSVDAGSKHITIEIKSGGTKYMRVSDDGCGIAFEDVPNAFLRHATSKILSADDLESIYTLGFRGEALASVSAVAKVEMRTKQSDDDFGTTYTIHGSVEQEHDYQGCADGTSIVVKDLFYNVPARQKFLKSVVSEGNAVNNIVGKIAVSHPEISFKFIRDGKVEFTTSGDNDLYSAIYSVYGKNFANDMLPVDYSENGITVKGFIVKPLYSKANRSYQNFFINKRYIKSTVCTVSLEEAYKGLIMTGKFPSCVLLLEINPSTIDVNAHPTKAEVKFSDEKIVFNSVFFAVKNALCKSGLIYEFQIKNESVPEIVELKTNEEFKRVTAPEKEVEKKVSIGLENFITGKQYDDIPDISLESLSESKDSKEELKSEEVTVPESFKYINTASFEKKKPIVDSENVFEDSITEKKEYINVIGEVFLNYIIAETDNAMVIIDKHAGHERIIYEQLKDRNKIMQSQYVMDTSEVMLEENQFEVLKENTELLKSIGFEFDLSTPYLARAKAVPMFLDSGLIDTAVEEIAQNLYLNKINPQTQFIDELFHSLACKSAIKANDKNSRDELQSLAEQVYFNENIRHCPHGRPVMFTLTKKEFEKQFRRIQ